MITKKFIYEKNEKEKRDVDLLVTENNDLYLEGIDLTKLNKDQIEKIKKITNDYYERLKEFYVAYRRFNKQNIK